MTKPLTISELRAELAMTQTEFAVAIGLSEGGKASVSLIEAGRRAISFDVALNIEALSDGRIDAARLNEQVARARGGDNLHGEGGKADAASQSTGNEDKNSPVGVAA